MHKIITSIDNPIATELASKAAQTDLATLDAKVAAVKTTADSAESKNAAQDTAIANKAETSTVAALTTRVSAAETAIGTKADSTAVTALSTTVSTNKTNQDAAIASAIANWASDRAYVKDQITIRNRTFFLALKDSVGSDPLTDVSGNWGIFTPGSANDIFANRSPTSADVHNIGVRWFDTSFGSDTPLGFVSLGSGAWSYTNQITLSKVRFYVQGINTTYQSAMRNIAFYKEDGTQIPNSWFTWGDGTLGKPAAGTAYSGQAISASGNANGWGEIDLSSVFDTSVPISKITGTLAYAYCNGIHFIYSNGGVKKFAGTTNLVIDPAQPSRYGDSVAAVLGTTLTAARLTDAASTEAGRVTGTEFTSAWNTLYQKESPLPTVQAGIDKDILLETIAKPSNIHLNSATFPVIWDVANTAVKDGIWHMVMNVGMEDHVITIQGADGVFRRNGTPNDLIMDGVLPVRSGETWMLHLTVGEFGRFLNCVRLGGGGESGETLMMINSLSARIAALEAAK